MTVFYFKIETSSSSTWFTSSPESLLLTLTGDRDHQHQHQHHEQGAKPQKHGRQRPRERERPLPGEEVRASGIYIYCIISDECGAAGEAGELSSTTAPSLTPSMMCWRLGAGVRWMRMKM